MNRPSDTPNLAAMASTNGMHTCSNNGGGGIMEGADAGGSKQERKYDRQLRLWGARGQRALMESHILLVNAGPTGTELLKNLVLPGVGCVA